MSDAVRRRLHTALGACYTIERELGRGGMAFVFLARDLRLGRAVALKVLRPEIAIALGAARFLLEIRLTARLVHPHILPLLDSGEADGLLYYVMPYVEGESLRDRLERERLLPVEDALRIARDVADALSYAHAQDVLHRDVKPENILLESGHAVVADFGVARAITAAGAEQLTESGVAVGTPGYMSPEQATGTRTLDARTDIYSLACVLYEMLGGEPPFPGPTPQAVLAKLLTEPVPHVATLRAGLSPALDGAITKALARVPADRFATATQFAEALADGARLVAPQKSIAVLPFANMSSDSESEYFSDGMTEEIINVLSHLPGLRVAARTSSFAFKGKQLPVRRLGEELQVATLLEGSVRRAGDTLRITAQLINAADGYHLWSERYDRSMADVFAVQDEIAAAIADTLKVTLLAEETPRVLRGTHDLEAYHLYLKGRHLWNQRAPARALEYFQQAIARDPGYAHAYAGLADTLCVFGQYGFAPSKEASAKARAAARQAVSLEERLPEGHFSLGCIDWYFGWDPEAAIRELQRAADLDPTWAAPVAVLGIQLSLIGRSDEAIAAARRARELEPFSPLIDAWAGVAYHFAGRYEDAIAVCQQGIELAPEWAPVLWVLSFPCTTLGRHDEAISALRRGAELMPRSPWIIGLLGSALAVAGRKAEANAVLQELASLAERQYVPPLSFAWIHLALGQMDEGFAWWERALDDRNAFAGYLHHVPGLEHLHLRALPRFNELLSKLATP